MHWNMITGFANGKVGEVRHLRCKSRRSKLIPHPSGTIANVRCCVDFFLPFVFLSSFTCAAQKDQLEQRSATGVSRHVVDGLGPLFKISGYVVGLKLLI